MVNGRRFFRGHFSRHHLPEGDLLRSFIRGRWANRRRASRARAAYFNRGEVQAQAPTIIIGTVNLYLPIVRRLEPRYIPRALHREVQLQARDSGPLMAISYRFGDKGEWHHAGDIAPGDTSIHIPEEKFPEANPGEIIPIQFKAFNGVAESPPTEPLTAVGNYPPVISVKEKVEPVVHEYGRLIELPFDVYERDGHPVSVHYRFDDGHEWLEAPTHGAPNRFRGDVFAHLDPAIEHIIHLLAFDGHDESSPVALPFFDVLKKAVSSVKGVISQLAPGGIEIGKGALAHRKCSRAHLAKSVLKAIAGALKGDSVKISYNVDDAKEWSKPVSYPLGEHEVFRFGDDISQPHFLPGRHRIGFRFQDESGRVTEDALHYTVNSPPALEVRHIGPLLFRGVPTGAVTLPILVSDPDDDPISVWYRFREENAWSHLPSAGGNAVLPAEAFSGRMKDGSGHVELFAWDGLEKSGDPVKIEYMAAGAEEEAGPVLRGEPAIEEEPPEEVGDLSSDSEAGDSLSPGAIAGIAVGGGVVVGLIIGIVILVTRKKPESSSGLVESE